MPKIREQNEQESLRLDESFKETLARVRPYVLQLTCRKSARLCRVWLDKLNTASSQRRLRNEYLMELCKQLRTGCIGGIFSRLPPDGLLLPLPRSYHMSIVRKDRRKICEQHISTLNTLIAELQTQHEYPMSRLPVYPPYRNVGDHLCANISQLTSEVSTLKAKLTEVQKIKHSMEESYKDVFQEYHYTVVEQFTELKQQLQEARLKNEALDNSIAVIAEKLEEIIHGKEEESKSIEKQWMDKIKVVCEQFDMFTREKNEELLMKQEMLDKKDLELSQKDAARKEDIELLTNKIHDLEMKLEMKIKDEDRVQTMLVEQYAMMKEEFNKIRNEIDHEAQKQNQSLLSKVNGLRKAVVKVEKSKEKLGYEYEKKMSHIIRNKDLEIKALHLQLQEQKNELCTVLSTKRQSEINNIVTSLEKRYRTLFAEMEAMSETQTQEYLRKMAALQDQVFSMQKI